MIDHNIEVGNNPLSNNSPVKPIIPIPETVIQDPAVAHEMYLTIDQHVQATQPKNVGKGSFFDALKKRTLQTGVNLGLDRIRSKFNPFRTPKQKIFDANGENILLQGKIEEGEQMKKQLMKDEKTGLLNEQGLKQFTHLIANTLARAPGHERLDFMFVDLNKFKILNDKSGHDAGDDAIREFSTILKNVFKRDEDGIARISGDEFCVVFSNPDPKYVEKIQKDFSDKLSAAKSEHLKTYGISIGLSSVENGKIVDALKDADPDKLYASLKIQADAAMYHAKKKPEELVRISRYEDIPIAT